MLDWIRNNVMNVLADFYTKIFHYCDDVSLVPPRPRTATCLPVLLIPRTRVRSNNWVQVVVLYGRILATIACRVHSKLLESYRLGKRKNFVEEVIIFVNQLVQLDLQESLPPWNQVLKPNFLKFNFSLVYRTKPHKFVARPFHEFLA